MPRCASILNEYVRRLSLAALQIALQAFASAAPTIVVSMLGAAPSAMCSGPDFDGNKNLIVRRPAALDPGGGGV